MTIDPLADEARSDEDLLAALTSLAPSALLNPAVRPRMREIMRVLDQRAGVAREVRMVLVDEATGDVIHRFDTAVVAPGDTYTATWNEPCAS